MDTLIEGYIKNTFHPDFCDLIKEAFILMDNFELPDYEFDFVNLLLSSDDAMPQATQDHFTTLIHQKLDFIIHSHLITLNDTTALHQKVAVLEGLYAVQHLNDYSNIVTILDSEYDHEEKLAEILEQVANITSLEFLTILKKFDKAILDTLKNYIYGKELNEGKIFTSYTETQRNIINNLKLFKKFNNDKKCLGIHLLDSSVLIGAPLKAYVPYVNDYLTNNDYKQLSLDLFSLLLLSNEGFNNPILAFRKHSGLLLDDLHSITKIDTLLTGLMLSFDKYKNNLEISGASA